MRRKFTVYGLRFSKTSFWNRMNTGFLDLAVATVLLTACGMRRRVRDSRGAKRRWGPHISSPWPKGGENKCNEVTVPTACGIETNISNLPCLILIELQQYLPLAVLKRDIEFTPIFVYAGCNSTYRLRYWNLSISKPYALLPSSSCNSTYRLRYATKGARQQRSKATMRPAHL